MRPATTPRPRRSAGTSTARSTPRTRASATRRIPRRARSSSERATSTGRRSSTRSPFTQAGSPASRSPPTTQPPQPATGPRSAAQRADLHPDRGRRRLPATRLGHRGQSRWLDEGRVCSDGNSRRLGAGPRQHYAADDQRNRAAREHTHRGSGNLDRHATDHLWVPVAALHVRLRGGGRGRPPARLLAPG